VIFAFSTALVFDWRLLGCCWGVWCCAVGYTAAHITARILSVAQCGCNPERRIGLACLSRFSLVDSLIGRSLSLRVFVSFHLCCAMLHRCRHCPSPCRPHSHTYPPPPLPTPPTHPPLCQSNIRYTRMCMHECACTSLGSLPVPCMLTADISLQHTHTYTQVVWYWGS
jgi:hypothetical protein